MLAPLVLKLKASTDKTEMLNLFSDIMKEAENLNYPNMEFKNNTFDLIKSTIQMYIDEYDSEYHRTYNARNLDAILLLDSL